MTYTFHKCERLCSRRLIDRLYAEGRRLMAYPYSIQWLAIDNADRAPSENRTSHPTPPSPHPAPPPPCQVMIVAPKRRFRHAVDRNRVKRLTRECYRMRKHLLYDLLAQNGLRIALALVYVGNEIMTYQQLERKMDKLVEALGADILRTQNPTPGQP